MIPSKSKFFKPDTGVFYNPETEEKIAIVTGGNQGIGYFTVLHLYLHGYTIYVLGRNEEKCLTAIEDIKKEAEERRSKYSETESSSRFLGKINYIKCDLTSLRSVEAAAKEFIKKEQKLDLLINNAGIMAAPYSETEDGIEIQFQVNAVSPLLLTLELLPYLGKAKGARVITVSSIAHTFAAKYLKPEDKLTKFPEQLYRFLRYSRSKLGVVHFTKALAKKRPDILFLAVHPGVIQSGLYDSTFASYSFLGPVIKTVFFKSISFMAISQEEGSLASLRSALDTNLTLENNGDYFIEGGVDSQASKIGQNPEYIKYTWDWCINKLSEEGFKFDI
ncbi:probable oxidoreductase Env9p [[Candida] jaroonii]|uniref:Probable oxidoreductase Env9p n=1 Tax=[Candida] jaroonii TaxID=467808 RepID=A0ACA9YFU8_9ASCO|nr:probable oxidoreductase Env9p [[Candida] jaroonii]